MNLTEYQKLSHETAIYPEYAIITEYSDDKGYMLKQANYIYPALGLSNECGEILGKLKKIGRDNKGIITEEVKQNLSKELGDVLWYLSELATTLDLELADIAKENIIKLHKRQQEGKIQGEGDNR